MAAGASHIFATLLSCDTAFHASGYRAQSGRASRCRRPLQPLKRIRRAADENLPSVVAWDHCPEHRTGQWSHPTGKSPICRSPNTPTTSGVFSASVQARLRHDRIHASTAMEKAAEAITILGGGCVDRLGVDGGSTAFAGGQLPAAIRS